LKILHNSGSPVAASTTVARSLIFSPLIVDARAGEILVVRMGLNL